MSKTQILDASAVLAYLHQERGQDIVESALDEGSCWMSAVNLCEVLGKLCEQGMPPDEAHATVNDLGLVVIDFDAELARLAASMRLRTKSIGASLGDRACLALAEKTITPHVTPIVYTAEVSWAKLKWPFRIVLIRSHKTNA